MVIGVQPGVQTHRIPIGELKQEQDLTLHDLTRVQTHRIPIGELKLVTTSTMPRTAVSSNAQNSDWGIETFMGQSQRQRNGTFKRTEFRLGN